MQQAAKGIGRRRAYRLAYTVSVIILLAVLCWQVTWPLPPLIQTKIFAQQQPEVIRVQTSLVSVPVSVTDATGRFVTGLTPTDFELFEDGIPQEIASFAATTAPFHVALLIDTSRSASGLLPAIRKATLSFVRQLQPQDRVLIVTFDEAVTVRAGFTSDRQQLEQAIKSLKSSYLTAIYDGISQTLSEQLARLEGRKAMVLFSDGIDTLSKRATCKSTLELVARMGVLVYPVQYHSFRSGDAMSEPCSLKHNRFPLGYGTASADVRATADRHWLATNFLRAVAEQSGARYLEAAEVEKSERAFTQIAEELRHQYTLGYYSTQEQQKSGYRTITVRTLKSGVIIRARPGYLVPRTGT